ncbi:hypothetical protein FGF1_03420 [Flavobacteriaceae bacterium GF1]
MIVEERLIPIFDTLPAQTIGGSDYIPHFDFGSHRDLLLYLNHKSKKGGKRYPLTWLQTPFKVTGDKRLEVRLKLVLATLSNGEMSNRERLEVTFKPTLYPLLINVKKALNRSGFTRILDADRNVQTNFFKYGFNGQNEVTDIWDAIKFECLLEMTETPIACLH